MFDASDLTDNSFETASRHVIARFQPLKGVKRWGGISATGMAKDNL
jgi:hypothetical protein